MSDQAAAKIAALLTVTERFDPPAGVVEAATVKDPKAYVAAANADPLAYWAERAQSLTWTKPWDEVCRFEMPDHQWFIGGRTNISINCLDRHVQAGRGDAKAMTFVSENGEERSFTYAEALAEVCRIANGLKSLGVARGDRVVIYMPLTPEGVFSMHACARIGAVHSMVYAGMGEGALKKRIQDSGAKVVLVSDATWRRGKIVDLKGIVDRALAGDDAPKLDHVVVLSRTGREVAAGEVDFASLIAHQPDFIEAEEMEAEDPLFILYTSGTTGAPKGVVHVHGGYMVGCDTLIRTFFGVTQDSVWWSLSDIGWIVGHSYIAYGPMLVGCHQIIREGTPDYPDAGVTWDVVDRFGVTEMFTAPTAVRMWMRFGSDFVKKYSRRSLKVMACAGEPLNPEAWSWAQREILSDDGEAFAHCVDNFFQTEVASPMLGTYPAMATRPGRAGIAMPTLLARIVDPETGADVPNGQGGLFVVEKPLPYMLRTVWGDPKRYASYWSERLGGYVTGDLAVRDDEGYIALLGRSDDVINVAGHRIGTADVESSLVGHPAVAEAAVVGLPDELKGEKIKAFVVVRAGETGDQALVAKLVAHVREDLGPIAQPSELVIVDKLPKTRSGKIMRRLLKARELGLPEGDTSTLDE
ncbi:acetate--CoA ligase [Tistrella mobilis]